MKEIGVVLFAAFCLSKASFTLTNPTEKGNAPAAKTAAGPVKKDGTPDMRHKANPKPPLKRKDKKSGWTHIKKAFLFGKAFYGYGSFPFGK